MPSSEIPVIERDLADVSEEARAVIAFGPAACLDVVEPQPLFEKMLREHPRLRTEAGIAFFRMEDVVTAGRDPSIISEIQVGFETMGSREALIPLHVDGERHTTYRKILDPLLAPRKVAALEPKVRALASNLVDRFIDDGHVEFHDAFAEPLPSQTFLELFGLPVDDAHLLIGIKDEILKNEGANQAEHNSIAVGAGDRLKAYLDAEVRRREAEAEPRDDLLGACMSYVSSEGKRLTHDEILNVAHLFVIAGLDTVTASLTCVIGWLARHPAEQERVRNDASLLPAAIEELMRYENPVLAGGPRFATQDTEVNGAPVRAGDMVSLCWTTANLDPEVFDRPLEVDLDRPANRHIAFAAGRHRCLGSNLARLELRTAIEEFHQRVGRYWITEGDEPRYNHQGVRAAEHLPLCFEPPAS